MKVKVESDELYPYFYLSADDDFGKELELDDDEITFVKETMSNFWKVQKMLAVAHKDGFEYTL
jgi:hypothetical protein